MNRRLISSGSSFEKRDRLFAGGRRWEWVFVSGTTGFDYQSMRISENLLEQAEQCLRNITSALEQAGASLSDVVRVTYILPKPATSLPAGRAPEILRRRPTCRYDDLRRFGRPADTYRDRSDSTPEPLDS